MVGYDVIKNQKINSMIISDPCDVQVYYDKNGKYRVCVGGENNTCAGTPHTMSYYMIPYHVIPHYHTHVRTNTCMHTHMHVHARTHAHTHTHTHTVLHRKK